MAGSFLKRLSWKANMQAFAIEAMASNIDNRHPAGPCRDCVFACWWSRHSLFGFVKRCSGYLTGLPPNSLDVAAGPLEASFPRRKASRFMFDATARGAFSVVYPQLSNANPWVLLIWASWVR